MDADRRQFLGGWGAVVTGAAAPLALPRPALQESHARPTNPINPTDPINPVGPVNPAVPVDPVDPVDPIARTEHERFMSLAIDRSLRLASLGMRQSEREIEKTVRTGVDLFLFGAGIRDLPGRKK